MKPLQVWQMTNCSSKQQQDQQQQQQQGRVLREASNCHIMFPTFSSYFHSSSTPHSLLPTLLALSHL
jgi:hypothetical protein